MLKGTRQGVINRIQPISVHGQPSLDVFWVDPDDPEGEIRHARVGNEAVVFFYKDPQMPGASTNVVFGLDCVYRVEAAFGAPVVVGKGEGFAFPENLKLDDARVAVRAAHLELAKKAGK